MKKKLLTVIIAIISALILCVSLTACGTSGGGNGVPDKGDSSSIVTDVTNRKIVYTVRYGIKSKDIATLRDRIVDKNAELGGYVENVSEEYNKDKCTYTYLTLRVPTDKLDDLTDEIEKEGRVKEKTVSSVDITTEYVSATAKKQALTEMKTAFNDILSDTTLTAEERITVIKEINKIDTQLKEIDLLINSYDSRLDFSTVYLEINTRAEDFVGSGIVGTIFIIGIMGATLFFAVNFGVTRKRLNNAVKKLKEDKKEDKKA